jgi:hypothetical protein
MSTIQQTCKAWHRSLSQTCQPEIECLRVHVILHGRGREKRGKSAIAQINSYVLLDSPESLNDSPSEREYLSSGGATSSASKLRMLSCELCRHL